MSFVQDADTLRSRLHATNVSAPVLVGLSACVLVIAALAVFWALDAFTGKGAVIEKATEQGSVERSDAEKDNVTDKDSAVVVVAHVSGAVVAPGVYRMDEGARVGEALEKAGGATAEANLDVVNLARVVVDGEHIVVPSAAESAQNPDDATGTAAGNTSLGSGTSQGLIDINTASASQLDSLPGIGTATAEKIIADRSINGPFRTKEDLKRVAGIGDKKYEALSDLIVAG